MPMGSLTTFRWGKGRLAYLNGAIISVDGWIKNSQVVLRCQMKAFISTDIANTVPFLMAVRSCKRRITAKRAVNGTWIKLLDIDATSQLGDERHISNRTLRAPTTASTSITPRSSMLACSDSEAPKLACI